MKKNSIQVIWISHQSRNDINSAIELGQEYLNNYNYIFISIAPSNASKMALLLRMLRNKNPIYFQLSNPLSNFFIALLILLGRRNINVHYLDDIAGGYPFIAKLFLLDKLIYYILKNAEHTIFISQVMLRYFRKKLELSNRTDVYFRTSSDHTASAKKSKLSYQKCFIYAGSINFKTNFSALKEVNLLCQQYKYNLHIYTRSTVAHYNNLLDLSNISFFPELSAKEVVITSMKYEAILLPFNLNKKSQKFYRMSTPSKIPNIIMARRPIVYFGPKKFWIYKWFKQYNDVIWDINTYFKVSNSGKRDYVDINLVKKLYKSFASLTSGKFNE